MPTTKRSFGNSSGFTLVETFMAMVIMAGGLLALASALAQGMIIMAGAHFHQIAKEKASEAIESVFTARDTMTITWDMICNVADGGTFLNGEQSLQTAGADGMVNTVDDGDIETATLPDGTVITLTGFTREIEIIDIGENGTKLREIRVTIRYPVGNVTRQYQLITYISAYA